MNELNLQPRVSNNQGFWEYLHLIILYVQVVFTFGTGDSCLEACLRLSKIKNPSPGAHLYSQLCKPYYKFQGKKGIVHLVFKSFLDTLSVDSCSAR